MFFRSDIWYDIPISHALYYVCRDRNLRKTRVKYIIYKFDCYLSGCVVLGSVLKPWCRTNLYSRRSVYNTTHSPQVVIIIAGKPRRRAAYIGNCTIIIYEDLCILYFKTIQGDSPSTPTPIYFHLIIILCLLLCLILYIIFYTCVCIIININKYIMR